MADHDVLALAHPTATPGSAGQAVWGSIRNEFRKGLLLLRARLGMLVLSAVGTSTMYAAIQLAIGRGALPDELIAQTLIGIAMWVLLFWAGSAMVGDLVEEARTGTLDQLRMALVPLRVSVLGRLAAALVQGSCAALLVLASTMLVLGAPFQLSAPALIPLALTVISALTWTGLLAGLALRVPVWRRVNTLFVGLIGMLNGAFLPVALLPDWLRAVAYLLPTTLGIDQIRRMNVDGATLATLWADGSLPLLLLHVAATLLTGYGMFAAAERHLAITGGAPDAGRRGGGAKLARASSRDTAADPAVPLSDIDAATGTSAWQPMRGEIRKALVLKWHERGGFLIELLIFLLFFILVNVYIGRGRLDPDLLATTLLGMTVVAFFHRQVGSVFWSLQDDIQSGTAEQLYMSPTPPGVLILARQLVAIVEGAVFAAALWLVVHAIWPIQLTSPSFDVLVPLTSIVVGVAGFALAIAGLALFLRRVDIIVQLLFGIGMFLGGVFLPLDQAPAWLATTGNVIVPITQGLQSLRDLLLPGGSGEPLATTLPWLIVQPLAWLVLGALLFRIGGSIARSGGLLNRY